MAAARKEAATKARKDAKRVADEAARAEQEKASRAKLEETERLKLEAADERVKAELAQKAAAAADTRLKMRDVILNDRVQLQPGAIEFLEAKVSAAMTGDGDLTVELAVRAAVAEHQYLLVGPDAPPPKPVLAFTEPVKTKETPTPAAAPKKSGVDVSGMTSQEFKDHLRSTYGAETRH